MKLRRFSLLQKGLLILLIPLVFQAGLLGMVLFQQRSHARAMDWTVHTNVVLQELNGIFEALLTTQVHLRGELLGLPSQPEEAANADRLLTRDLEMLTALVTDNRWQSERVEALRAAIEERRSWSREMRAMLGNGQRSEAVARFQTAEGVRRMENVRKELLAIRAREEQLYRERLEQLHASTHFLSNVLIGGLLLDVLLAAGAVMLVARSIGRRTRTLMENVNRVKLGVPLLAPTKGADELGDLDRSFHDMAHELAAARKNELEMQQTIQQHNAELTRANHELKDKNEENEMFVYSVSHDLRSPLVNLQGFSRELGSVRDDLHTLFATPVSEEARARGQRIVSRDIAEPILYIQSAVTRLSSIIDALLRLSRAGRVEYLATNVDVAATVQRIVDALRDSIVKKQATVTVEALPPVWGDKAALEQIFANLVVNAVNYLDPNRPGKVEIGAIPDASGEGRTIYFVRDNGLGIAEPHLPKLFTAFRRLHEKVAAGEGVGLALVRRTVERHGGKIWAESAAGKGTTFFVSFPPESASPLALPPKMDAPAAATPITQVTA